MAAAQLSVPKGQRFCGLGRARESCQSMVVIAFQSSSKTSCGRSPEIIFPTYSHLVQPQRSFCKNGLMSYKEGGQFLTAYNLQQRSGRIFCKYFTVVSNTNLSAGWACYLLRIHPFVLSNSKVNCNGFAATEIRISKKMKETVCQI